MNDDLSNNPGSLGALIKCKDVSIDISSSWSEIHDVFKEIKGIPLRHSYKVLSSVDTCFLAEIFVFPLFRFYLCSIPGIFYI